MTMTVGARSLDNEERSNFRDYMSLLSLSVDASMTVRERSEERRVGKECRIGCRSRWSPYH